MNTDIEARHETSCREVGGELVSGFNIDSSMTHVEILRRRSAGPIAWRFRQQRAALFWFRRGVSSLNLRLDGAPVRARVDEGSNFALFPASMLVEGEFEVARHCDYTVVFLDVQAVAESTRLRLDRPLIAFRSAHLQNSLPLLFREANVADGLYGLFADGWAMQALAVLARIGGGDAPVEPVRRGGLAAASLDRVVDFVNADIARPFTVQALAEVAGVSPRHFLRAFQQSTGSTPLRFIQKLRIEKAKELLSRAQASATEIALDCGFSHAQHFSTAFKKATGETPSSYRRRSPG
ncbi:AraC family transcriptional regulator [Variovorax sp. J2P1-31]|nr:AraC family transcriptional regulator [Variovorax sp. J2P1-31]MDM0086724.1 AraC family transcriptional regulator [Variovorax sp. J22G40]MDM0145020.1 AraC family transcriptional regulator [Variovorax sp. J2P1-31]